MIVSRLQGGLGNQLFQYAAARVLADDCGQDLGLDLRALLAAAGRGDSTRPYFLDRLRTRARVLSGAALVLRGQFQHRLWRRVLRVASLCRGRYVHERGQAYQALPRARAGVFLDGYWQSWRYLEGGRRRLLQDLVPLRAPSGRNASLLKRLAHQNAVCVHVRRGDYASLPAAGAFHGLLGQDYYRAALKRLGAAARGAVFYVFSDEPAWARRHLALPGPRVLVAHNSVMEPEEDLRLMAACRHFIIANSSLSWWGAWLGQRAGKKVLAPERWFKAGPPTPDLCPPAWVRL